MYDYIKGTITDITTKSITIECGNIGYILRTPNPYNFEIDKEAYVYTYLHVREDIFELYGFETKNERDFFLSLISVKGLGPKGALAILASGKVEETIQAIESGNNKFLERFPGIGAKASQQIILDLHGKLNFNQVVTKKLEDPKVDSVREALKNLGYKAQEIKRIEPILEAHLEEPIGALIKIALKALLKN